MKTAKTKTPKMPEPMPNKPEASNTPTRAKPHRKIDASVLAQMATAVAKMLTESEAARLCGLEPRHWFEWKSRAGRAGKFQALLEHCRGVRIQNLIQRIEKSADGIDTKYPDFRAALALLKITDPKRFGDSPISPVLVQQTAIVVQAGGPEKLRKMIEHYAELNKPATAQRQKALPAVTLQADDGEINRDAGELQP